MTPLLVPESIINEMIAHGRADSPREACGLVAFGPEVVAVYPTPNSSPDDERFLIDPRDVFNATTDAEQRGWRIGGMYHSHPFGPASLSATDRDAPNDPSWFSFLVVGGPTEWTVRAFRVDDGTEIPVETMADASSLR